MEGVLYDISGAPNGNVPSFLRSYGISGWLARKRKCMCKKCRKKEQINLLFKTISENLCEMLFI